MTVAKIVSVTRRTPRRVTAEDRRRAIEAEAERRAAARRLSQSREHDAVRWFAIHTNPNCERRVELGLIGLGLCAYLPEGKRWFFPRRPRKGGPSHIEKLRPAFSRYVFVGFPGDDVPDLYSVDGVRGVLGNGRYGEPIRLSAGDIAVVRAAQASGKLDFGRNPSRFEIGAEVEVLYSLLMGMRGVIVSDRIDGGYKVDLGWTSGPVIVPVDDLRVVA